MVNDDDELIAVLDDILITVLHAQRKHQANKSDVDIQYYKVLAKERGTRMEIMRTAMQAMPVTHLERDDTTAWDEFVKELGTCVEEWFDEDGNAVQKLSWPQHKV